MGEPQPPPPPERAGGRMWPGARLTGPATSGPTTSRPAELRDRQGADEPAGRPMGMSRSQTQPQLSRASAGELSCSRPDPQEPYPQYPPVTFFYLKQRSSPRRWCLAIVSNKYPAHSRAAKHQADGRGRLAPASGRIR